MKTINITPDARIESFVHTITILEELAEDADSVLPFFADGSPGIMFRQATNVFLLPAKKKLSELFLYGQTIDPIELSVKGKYRFIVFQLYPFASHGLIGVNPRKLSNDCYDLTQIPNQNVKAIVNDLNNTSDIYNQVEIMSAFFVSLIKEKSNNTDTRIQLAISLMMSSRGKLPIKSLREKINITDRTFERQFAGQVGVTPKQFAKIIQFQFSLNQLTEEEYSKLTDIVFDNGFADQSHFIRTFKKYTGQTPAEFQKRVKIRPFNN